MMSLERIAYHCHLLLLSLPVSSKKLELCGSIRTPRALGSAGRLTERNLDKCKRPPLVDHSHRRSFVWVD
jgi:hypothetical protein